MKDLTIQEGGMARRISPAILIALALLSAASE